MLMITFILVLVFGRKHANRILQKRFNVTIESMFSSLKKSFVLKAGFLMALLLTGCTIGLNNKSVNFNPEGIYECKPMEGFTGPVYKFNTTDERTVVHIGTNNSIEFFDLNSEKTIRLYQDSNFQYDCKCIDTIQNKKEQKTRIIKVTTKN